MTKLELLLKEIETVNDRYIEDRTNTGYYLPSVSLNIISSAKKVAKLLHFMNLDIYPTYNNNIRFDFCDKGDYVGIYLDEEGVLISFALKNEGGVFFAEFPHEELTDVG